MFTQFALVVIFAIAVSLLDAATVVPMLATRLFHGAEHQDTEGTAKSRGLGSRLHSPLRPMAHPGRAQLSGRPPVGTSPPALAMILGALGFTRHSPAAAPAYRHGIDAADRQRELHRRSPACRWGRALEVTNHMIQTAGTSRAPGVPDVQTLSRGPGSTLTPPGASTALIPSRRACR